MESSGFDGSNCVLNPPQGMSADECSPISVLRGRLESGAMAIVSCWKPTRTELEEIERTGRVWILCLGMTQPPMSVLAFDPAEHVDPDPRRG